ncbi:MAG TPA: glycosyl hydrolase family 18 protein [Anaerolineales bacterium]|nr:glycosyl hydrolase family 18 protein [Anaerolineales bacterium]
MRRLFLGLCLFAVLLSSCSSRATPVNTVQPIPPPVMTPTTVPRPFIILAYATAGITQELIPYEQLTHINYSFLIPNEDGTFNPILNGWKLKQIVETAHQHDVPVSIAVGGWGWDAQFEALAAHPESRTAFVQNLVAFVNEYQLDGADIDWEYPDAGQSSQNFLALIKELRAALPDKLLTAAVVAYGDTNGIGVPTESFELFDFVNIMTYDGPDHGSMEQFEKGLSYWSQRGLPKEKIVMGVPFYSRIKDSSSEGISYAKLVQAVPSASQTDELDFYGLHIYNGIPTIQAKTHIAMERASGIMFWALDHDMHGEFSLVNAIYQMVHKP